MNIERSNLVVATRQISTESIQALVGRKLRGDFAGTVTFPGGKNGWNGERFEDKTKAAQREFKEETGIDVVLEELRQAGRIRLYGDRFGLIDIFHTKAATIEPTSSDEMEMSWRTVDQDFYTDMPEDTQEWLPLVFSGNSFRINAAWRAGQLCLLANGDDDLPQEIAAYFSHANRELISDTVS